MNYARGKLAAALSVSILLIQLILLNVPIHSMQLQSPEPVDVAVTDITNVNGMVIYFAGGNRTSGANVSINVNVTRLDNNIVVPLLMVNVTLNRMNVATLENMTIANSTVLLTSLSEVKVQLLWNENLSTLSAGNYDIYGFADPIGPGNVYDTDTTNNIEFDGRVEVVVCKEDLNGDGNVDVLDGILLQGSYGHTGPPGWIPQDLMPDGVVDWFDKLMLSRMFGWTIANRRLFKLNAQAWNLTISTPPGQTKNDTVTVLSDYIVYSEYSFDRILGQLRFNITSSIDGFCNVTIPKTSMSGAFTVYLDDVPTPAIVTWNATHYFVNFTSTGLSQKVKIVTGPVDVAVTDVTNVGGMVICFCGTNRTSGTNVPINVTVVRLDNNVAISLVEVNVTLNRTNVATSENVTVANNTVLLAPSAGAIVQFLWNETLSTLTAGNYDMYAFVDPIGPGNVYDTNVTNNVGIGGRVNVLVVKEDLNGDGNIDALDAIILGGAYGQTGPPRWIPQDLMPDGVVDYFDWLMLARMFGWSITNSSLQPIPVAWNLTIAAPPGPPHQTLPNDTVIVFSDYIVYSQYSFNTKLKQLSFNITSSIDGFCNVTIPKTSMSGAFTVYLDDVPTPSIVTWNATHYFVNFTTTDLSQKVKIVSEYTDEIYGDLNHDGSVDIYDAIRMANHWNWHYP
jgi:hypothetical protein